MMFAYTCDVCLQGFNTEKEYIKHKENDFFHKLGMEGKLKWHTRNK